MDNETLESLGSQESAEQEGAVASQESGAETEEQEGGKEQRDAGAAAQEEDARKEQSRAENARIAAARRAGEQAGFNKGYRQRQQEDDERIARQGIPHPDRQGEVIRSVDDYEAYGRSYRAKRDNKTPEQVAQDDELRRWHDEKAEQQQKERSEKERREFMQQDMEDFRAQYPDVDLGKLLKTPTFAKFCGSRLGKESLAGLYEDYTELYGEVRQSAQASSRSKAERATGSGGGTGAADGLTKQQQAELDEWNRTYPQMKMTAKEFLGR